MEDNERLQHDREIIIKRLKGMFGLGKDRSSFELAKNEEIALLEFMILTCRSAFRTSLRKRPGQDFSIMRQNIQNSLPLFNSKISIFDPYEEVSNSYKRELMKIDKEVQGLKSQIEDHALVIAKREACTKEIEGNLLNARRRYSKLVFECESLEKQVYQARLELIKRKFGNQEQISEEEKDLLLGLMDRELYDTEHEEL